MNRHTCLFAVVAFTFLASTITRATAAAPQHEPGLVGEYFALEGEVSDFPQLATTRRPTLVRVDKQVSFVEGAFAPTKLSENFFARWTGVLKVDKPGKYTLATRSDDGSRLFINGKLVVDNGGLHATTKRTGNLDLEAGTHELRLEFFQSGGGASCELLWIPPGAEGGERPVPASALLHAKGAEKIAWDEAAWKKLKGPAGDGDAPREVSGAWAVMDYGPFLSATVGAARPSGNVANKGIVIKLGPEGEAGVLFDTDLVRMAAGWTGGFLKLQGVAFDGAHGPHPQAAGEVKFGTSQTPGWARPRTKDFVEPRSEPFGPLPPKWAKYRGLYLHGGQVVLSYTVGQAEMLEAPGVEYAGEGAARQAFFTRTFKAGPSDHSLTLLVAETDGGSGRVAHVSEVRPENEPWPQAGPADKTTATLDNGELTVAAFDGDVEGLWEIVKEGDRSRILLTVPPRDKPANFQVILWGGKPAPGNPTVTVVKERLAKAREPIDLGALTAGGPPRWAETLTTTGTLGDARPVRKGEPPPAYAVDTITVPAENPWKSWLRFGGFDFFKGGKSAALCTWSGDVWVVSGIDDKLEKLTWKRYATGLHQPLGLRIVDDKVYVHGRDQITRLHDLNNDGEADFYENFNNDVHTTSGFHEFAYDLQTDAEGNFYLIKGGPVNPGGGGFQKLAAHHGTLMKVSKDGSKLEVVATGFRAPNGIGVGPKGELTSGDNQGTWTPACRLNWIKPGGFYGVVDLAHRTPPPTVTDNPLCWLPMSWDNSSGGQVWVTSDRWGPLKGELLHMSYGQSALYLVLREKAGAEMQGGITRIPLKFESSLMRGRFNDADGQLYVCGLQGWQTNAAKATGFQRVRYLPGKPLYLPSGMRVKDKGIELTFTQPLDPETANDAGSYDIQQWNYKWTSGYGSDEYKPSDGKKGRDTLEVKSAKLSGDRKTVYLETPDLKPVMQVLIKAKLDAADGTEIDAEVAGTVNFVPPDQKLVVTAPK